MEDLLRPLAEKLIEKASLEILVLVFVILLLSWLLIKMQKSKDLLANELTKNSVTLARLTELVNNLVYGRK